MKTGKKQVDLVAFETEEGVSDEALAAVVGGTGAATSSSKAKDIFHSIGDAALDTLDNGSFHHSIPVPQGSFGNNHQPTAPTTSWNDLLHKGGHEPVGLPTVPGEQVKPAAATHPDTPQAKGGHDTVDLPKMPGEHVTPAHGWQSAKPSAGAGETPKGPTIGAQRFDSAGWAASQGASQLAELLKTPTVSVTDGKGFTHGHDSADGYVGTSTGLHARDGSVSADLNAGAGASFRAGLDGVHGTAGAEATQNVQLGRYVSVSAQEGASATVNVGPTGASVEVQAGATIRVDGPGGLYAQESANAGAGAEAGLHGGNITVGANAGVSLSESAGINQSQTIGGGLNVVGGVNVNASVQATEGADASIGKNGVRAGEFANAGDYVSATYDYGANVDGYGFKNTEGVIAPGSVGEGVTGNAHYEKGELSLSFGGTADAGLFGVTGSTELDINLKPLINLGEQIAHNPHETGHIIEGAAHSTASTIASDSTHVAGAIASDGGKAADAMAAALAHQNQIASEALHTATSALNSEAHKAEHAVSNAAHEAGDAFKSLGHKLHI